MEKFKKVSEDFTCFGLAHCCGLEKECPGRDKALEELGLTKEDYVKIKQKMDEVFYEIYKRRKKGC